jgi:hypothetical protein
LDQDQLDPTLDALSALFAASDFRAGNVFREAAPMLRATFGDAVGFIESRLDNYDYPEALAALRALRSGAKLVTTATVGEVAS